MADQLRQRTDKKITAGVASPRGAMIKKDGVNFAIFSSSATAIFLLLFDEPHGEPTDVIQLEHRTGNVWHVYVHGITAFQLYGYKVAGPYDPPQAMRFNPHKLLLDPYAKAITHKAKNIDNLLLGYDAHAPMMDLVMDTRDNTSIVPKSIVIDDAFDWQGDRSPHIPLEDLIVYEVHLKGFTADKSANVQHPGTYSGFIEKIPYLKDLGINAVELLPVQESHTRDFLTNNGLIDYWGYNTIGYFAPESSYATGQTPGCQVAEFKTLVRELHKAGIEVILDVVYNHTGEGGHLDSTLCFRGLDNGTFYALEGPVAEPYRFYRQEATGCGNTLNAARASVRHGVIDSLRYWVQEMHVDGFRFDLAPVLASEKGKFHRDAAFFRSIASDHVLRRVKLIAEPWDLQSHQLGKFPSGWLEWNDKFRDTVRRFNKGESGTRKDFVWRMTGSQDIFMMEGKNPYESVNFMTCHDGFTLNDLYCFNEKRNQANLEGNHDGAYHNYSWNCGQEGLSNDPGIIRLRKKMIKNSLCYLFFSLGTPMLLAGDEMMRTQQGNNNAYCQDNEVSWINWDHLKQHEDIFLFCRKLIAFRLQNKIGQKVRILPKADAGLEQISEIKWFDKDLKEPVWEDAQKMVVCYQLEGRDHNRSAGFYSMYFIFNAGESVETVQLPEVEHMSWCRLVDTSLTDGQDFLDDINSGLLENQDQYIVRERSVVVLMGH